MTREELWSRACADLGIAGPCPSAWEFGDNPELADELVALVLSGRKTATSASLPHMLADHDPIPVEGDMNILLNGSGDAECVVKTTEVRIRRFCDVDADYAAAEGEDDLSLESWQREHEKYLVRTLPSVNLEFQPGHPLVCQRFIVVYPTK